MNPVRSIVFTFGGTDITESTFDSGIVTKNILRTG